MKHILHLVALGLLTILPSTHTMAQKSIIINEIMQSNVDFLMVDHDFPDSWVELYNASDTRINIQNYLISPVKVASDSKRIISTEQYIEPGGHLLVFLFQEFQLLPEFLSLLRVHIPRNVLKLPTLQVVFHDIHVQQVLQCRHPASLAPAQGHNVVAEPVVRECEHIMNCQSV